MENIQEEIEDKVIDDINSGAGGRLIIFKPEKNNFGADLVVEQRGKYKEKGMSFQVNTFIAPAEAKNFVKDFPQKNFKADKNFYLLFVYFNEATQKMSDYIWLIPSLQFKDIADVANKNLLRFDVPLDIKNKNKYLKFVVNTKDLGKMILAAFEKKGKFDFKESSGENIINLENLKEFLCEARRNTYAADVTGIDNPRLLASTQLEFQKGEYYYRDIFFNGSKRFIGQEIIYYSLKPIWGMNYIGTAQGAPLGKSETSFLKEALFKLAKKCRLGGVCEYEKREYKYQDKGQGNLDDFSGKEEIFLEGRSIYKLNYQGGLITNKA